ncbi:aminotransferase class IV [Acrocarpospora catenulata]|uniref:aminotransferase class IV n=1 Tax=Acrocarpospora catenulata TaxID=2836182 RepID=UPI001BD934E9|nr:aminotransferase class IV [Acrocarpospora catenulata]
MQRDHRSQVFHAGAWCDAADATVPVGGLALRYGVSVFEGVRLYRRADRSGVRPFLLDAHVRRLGYSLALSRIPDPGIDKIPELVDDLVLRNGIDDDAYLRIAVNAVNPGLMDAEVEPALTISATPMGRKRWLRDGAWEGMRLQVSLWQRACDLAFPSAAKGIPNYGGPRLALLDAKAAGFDGCVLTNAAGRLCEAPTAALFLVRDGELLTPALTEGVLPSITRRWVLDRASALGLTARETVLGRIDAYQADEAFLCGTGLEFAPVRSFDGHAVRAWPDSPVTRALVGRYFEEVRS